MSEPTLIKGLDAAEDVSRHAKALYDLGYRFVIRYISPNTEAHPTKRIDRAELAALHAAGLAVGFIWEVGDDLAALTPATGKIHADLALDVLRGLKVPIGIDCGFAADADVPANLAEQVCGYFAAVHTEFEGTPYLTEDYGSGWLLSTLKAKGDAHYGWLAQSMGWDGSRDYQGWDIKQLMATAPFSIDGDQCVAKSLTGMWLP